VANKYLEELASLEHDQWQGWAKAILKKEPSITEDRRKRWEKLFVPYSELSDKSKEQDRRYARRVLEIIGKKDE
jgi:hypothetical protein